MSSAERPASPHEQARDPGTVVSRRGVGHFVDAQAEARFRAAYAEGMARPRDEQLRELQVPTLALIAGRSVIHDPAKALERARSLLPDVQAELWSGATHAINGEFADAVNARVLHFVREVDARSALTA